MPRTTRFLLALALGFALDAHPARAGSTACILTPEQLSDYWNLQNLAERDAYVVALLRGRKEGLALRVATHLGANGFEFKTPHGAAIAREVQALPFSGADANGSGTAQFPPGYFLMTRLFGDGSFRSVRNLMPKIREAGIKLLWISPPQGQTLAADAITGERNVHGYWVDSHRLVDKGAGGLVEFKLMVQEARAKGIEIALDMVLNHFGPGTRTVKINRKTVSVDDPTYFRPQNPNGEFGQPREGEIHGLMESAKTPEQMRALWNELTEYNLWRLPSLQHRNPEVRAHLINSFKRFVDYGVSVFRVDAPKYIPESFLLEMTHELVKYGKQKGVNVRFFWEFLVEKPGPLAVVAKEVIAQLPDSRSILFIDFPLARELRRIETEGSNYRLEWLLGFLKYRDDNGHPTRNYVPMIENHDFEHPLQSVFHSRLIYELSEFVSENPTVIHHGTERSGKAPTGREQIDTIDVDGDKLRIRSDMTDALSKYREAPTPSRVEHVAGGGDFLIIKRTTGRKSVFLAVNRSDQPMERLIGGGGTVAVVNSEGNASVHSDAGGVKVTLPPRSFVAFEVTQ